MTCIFEKEIIFNVLVHFIRVPIPCTSLPSSFANEILHLYLYCACPFLAIRCQNSHDLPNISSNTKLRKPMWLVDMLWGGEKVSSDGITILWLPLGTTPEPIHDLLSEIIYSLA